MNHNLHGKGPWLMMAAIVIIALVLATIFHIGALALLLLICPVMMFLMMAFMMKGMNHNGPGQDSNRKH
jgi:hypothetical protein